MTTQASRHAPAHGEAVEQARGLRTIALLAVLTLAEYLVAVALHGSVVALVAMLSVVAVLKGWLIVTYFMHLAKVWRGEEEHA